MLKYQSQLDHFSERGRERDCYLTPDHGHKAADTAGSSERSMSVFSAGQVYVRTVLVYRSGGDLSIYFTTLYR